MFQKPKGTYDVTPKESHLWTTLESHIHALMKKYHYSYVRTPVFETYDVFHRQSEQSDMVNKETYDFKDRGDRMLTLRPEGTAGVIRSVIENKLIKPGHVLPLYYMGPNYRYERPQKGRFREFYQFGVEVIGDAHPSLDADVMILAYELIQGLNIPNVTIKMNYIGTTETRTKYTAALVSYFSPLKDSLSKESQLRLEKNPLRILDSKQKEDQTYISQAPNIHTFLTSEEVSYLDAVMMLLKANQVNVELDHRLVRGLDYYAHIVFEIQADVEGLGSQNALGGGGRYDHLVKELGGPDISGIGFAFGMERLLLAMNTTDPSNQVDIMIITQDEKIFPYAYELLSQFRAQGLNVFYDFAYKSMKSQLKQASQIGATYAIIIGEDEVKNNTVTIKNLIAFEQITIPKQDINTYIKK
mgnify:CR=1 FL=1